MRTELSLANQTRFGSMVERLRVLGAPRGSGSLLCCQLSPHDHGTSLAVAGEEATAAVFDLRGDGLLTHHLSAASGCFAAGEAVCGWGLVFGV